MASKYNNRKTFIDGIAFDSRKEASRYQILKEAEKAREIENLRLQVRFELIPKHGKNRPIYYIADFVYLKEGREIVEDCKGYRTDIYKMKKKIFEWRYDTEILET